MSASVGATAGVPTPMCMLCSPISLPPIYLTSLDFFGKKSQVFSLSPLYTPSPTLYAPPCLHCMSPSFLASLATSAFFLLLLHDSPHFKAVVLQCMRCFTQIRIGFWSWVVPCGVSLIWLSCRTEETIREVVGPCLIFSWIASTWYTETSINQPGPDKHNCMVINHRLHNLNAPGIKTWYKN